MRLFKKNFFFQLLFLLPSIAVIAQPKSAVEVLDGQWLLEFQHTDIGMVRTTMRFETGATTFHAYTRRKADKDILGGWTAMLGRTFTKSFKGGSLLRIEKGIFAMKGDTLKIAGILTSALGNYSLQGYVIHDVLFANLRDGRGQERGTLKGNREDIQLPLEDYPALFEKSLALTESKIYDPAILKTEAWKRFSDNTRGVSKKVQDDLEMVFAFFYYAGKLPFSHYALLKIPEKGNNTNESAYQPCLFLEEKTAQTAYLRIVSFGGRAAEVDSIFSIIKNRNYQNLIVDLRNNTGGSVEAGMAFATQVADTTFYGGVFLTQKYFNQHQTIPTLAEYEKFPHFTKANFDLIIEGIHQTEGLCLKVIPQENKYHGKLYILTNKRTASTCEPVVYGLKQRKRALIVGETTAGSMLNGETLNLDKGFKMVIPTADYYAVDGYHIDQKGVRPDITVKQEEALKYVLENLIGK